MVKYQLDFLRGLPVVTDLVRLLKNYVPFLSYNLVAYGIVVYIHILYAEDKI